MYRLKAAFLVALVIAALTFTVLNLSNNAVVLSSNVIEIEHARLQDALKEKLLNTEASISLQANELSTDPTLVQELSSIREKLLNNTPEDLKKISNNLWNDPVFNRIIDWKKNKDSAIKQHEASLSSIMQAETGSMKAQKPLDNWLAKSPDLILAFASVPMKDGSISSTLIAQGFEGKKLQAGKRFDKDIPVLDEVNASHKAQFVHFVWNKKMYLAIVAPVMNADTFVGSIVVGTELSKDLITAFSKILPSYNEILFVYSSPKPGDTGSNPQRVIYADNDSTRRTIESAQFHVNANEIAPNAATIRFDLFQPNIVYTGMDDISKNYAVSRLRWTWDSTQETDVYLVSDLKSANKSIDSFKTNVLIAGVIALILGVILAILIVSLVLKDMKSIRKAVSEAINSGEPIDVKAMALLMDENPDDIAPYTIKQVISDQDENDDWSNLMMDFSDEANTKADEELAPEEKENLKQSADIQEAKPIYEEYMRLRKENNINTPMDFDCFLRRLQRNAKKIKEQYHCESVTFKVHVSNGNVLLKPEIKKH